MGETAGGPGWSVELRTLRVFLVVAEELSFTRAARRVLLTPSRVSQLVRALERHVGGALFDRSSRRVVLTELGRGLRDDLAPLCAGLDDALAARLPISDVDLVVGPRLSRESRVLIVARDHPLAGRTSVTWEDVADHVVIDTPAMPREMMADLMPPWTASGRPVRRAIHHSFASMSTDIVAGRLVHAAVPSLARFMADLPVLAVPITDLPPSETALVWRVERGDWPLLATFAQHLGRWLVALTLP